MSHPDKERQLTGCHPHGTRVVSTLAVKQSKALEFDYFGDAWTMVTPSRVFVLASPIERQRLNREN